MQVVCVLIRNPEVIFDFVEECFRFGARIAWNQEAVFLEFPSPRSMYSLEELFNSIEILAEHFDIQTRIATAEDAPTALCYAHYGVMPKENLPLESLRHYYSPLVFPDELASFIRALRSSGYRNLKDIAHLLPSLLRTQFGDKAWEAVRRAREKSGRVWPGFSFLENFSEENTEQQEFTFPLVAAS